jgi:hypothetical protein
VLSGHLSVSLLSSGKLKLMSLLSSSSGGGSGCLSFSFSFFGSLLVLFALCFGLSLSLFSLSFRFLDISQGIFPSLFCLFVFLL